MTLTLDTETTGLFSKGAQWDVDYKEYPYILSMAWSVKKVCNYHMIYQEGRKVPQAATDTNGITTAMSNDRKKTRPAKDVYKELIEDALKADTIVGHNIYFDTAIVKANVLKEFGPASKEAKQIVEGLHKDKRIDTMRGTVHIFRKWPRLEELHAYLFPQLKFNAHNAMEDVLATERCYIELKKRKLI